MDGFTAEYLANLTADLTGKVLEAAGRKLREALSGTEEQARNSSIDNQLERTAAYIEGMGWEVAATFTEPGESGADLDRPALNECRAAARAGEYDTLVIHDLDRFNRNLRDLLNLRHEFQQLGIPVWSICDNLELTSCDEAAFIQVVMRGAFAQVERTKLGRRMREGLERHVKSGKYPGGLPPYGYARGEDDRLVIDEETAAVVRSIFAWAAEGMSGRAIARRLNALAIPSPWARRGIKSRRRNDRAQQVPQWKPTTVREILRAETYIGRWAFGRTSDSPEIVIEVPPIIDLPTWEKAQETAEKNKRYTRPPKHQYLLRGLIRCECGASYCGHTPRRKSGGHNYRCTARYNWERLGTRKCYSLTVSGVELEKAVWSDIEMFLRQPHLVADELNRRREPAGAGVAARLAEVDRAIAERKAELDRYLLLYGRGTIPVEQLDAKAEEVQGGLAALETYRASLVEEQRRADLWEHEMVGLMEVLTTLQQRLDGNLSFDDKRAFVKMLVKDILIETHTDERGTPYSVAHVTYRFERPSAEAPIPVELEPLFASTELAENWQIPSSVVQ